jgi:hypothetical protein
MVRVIIVGTVMGLFLLILGCSRKSVEKSVASPDGQLNVCFNLEKGYATYAISKGTKEVIKRSGLGFQFKNSEALKGNL